MKRIIKNSRLTSRYGNRRHPVTKEKSFHNGVDLAAPVGTPVTAPTGGVCTQVYNHEKGGLTFIFLMDNDLELRMCHLSKTYLTEGQRCCAGDIICLTGNTGRSTGPHLHLGVVNKGVRVDPLTIYKM